MKYALNPRDFGPLKVTQLDRGWLKIEPANAPYDPEDKTYEALFPPQERSILLGPEGSIWVRVVQHCDKPVGQEFAEKILKAWAGRIEEV